MAPSSIYYTDYRQSASRHEEPGREHIQTLEDVYSFEPVSNELTEAEKAAVLGAQVTVFSEHMRTEARVEHMAFPRALALAETVWSAPGDKDFNGFVARLMDHWPRLRALDLEPADSAFGVAFDIVADGDMRTVTLTNQAGQGTIRYTTDGSAPTPASSAYDGPFEAGADARIAAATFHDGAALSRVRTRALDRLSLSERTSDELALCSKELAIKLDDDYPAEGPRAAMLVDIMKPCWVYQAPDMAGVTGVEVAVGNLPYNFQIGDMIERVDLLAPQTEAGEIVIFKDSCETGAELARLPLAPAAEHHGITNLTAPLTGAADVEALCFHVAASHYEPLWAIDRVRLTTEQTSAGAATEQE
jgi:hexosaminidase